MNKPRELMEDRSDLWRRNVEISEAFEKRCADLFRSRGHEVEHRLKAFDPPDLIVDGRSRIECKCDVRAVDTGNVCIQFEEMGKPSGIQDDTDFWLHGIGVEGKILLVSTLRLCRLLLPAVDDHSPSYAARIVEVRRGVCLTRNFLIPLDKFALLPMVRLWARDGEMAE